jgi:hypothetical protein
VLHAVATVVDEQDYALVGHYTHEDTVATVINEYPVKQLVGMVELSVHVYAPGDVH